MADKSLPPDWDQVLERLTHSLAHVEHALTQTGAAEPRAGAFDDFLRDHEAKIHALADKTTATRQWVDAIDSELRVTEDMLRVLLTQTETVRQKLATWASRAIG